MDIANLSHEATMLPTGAFLDASRCAPSETPTTSEYAFPWTQSPLNPQTRIDCLDPLENPSFRIDGCGEQGGRFFVVPLFLAPNITPSRIDVYVPKPAIHPPELRAVLGSNESCHVQDSRVASLGISALILRGLEHWVSQDTEIVKRFGDLPFGSQIVIANIPRHAEKMNITIFRGYGIERELLPVEALRSMWCLDHCEMPKTVDIGDLNLQMQVRDSISVVCMTCRGKEIGPLIFKMNIDNPGYLYHELKNLLLIPRHSNIIDRPLYLVTKRCSFGGKVGVCGFLLRHYPQGTLGNALSRHCHTSSPRGSRTKWQWACQITSALIHIKEEGKTFYPDLRPDNVLLSSSSAASSDGEADSRVILIDLEQRGNWSSWTAPEIRILEYLEILACPLNTHAPDLRTESLALLSRHGIPGGFRIEKRRRSYVNTHPGASRAWTSLSPEQQESAMVYALGKMIWCIFEEVGDTSVESRLWTSTPRESGLEEEGGAVGQEFPVFRRIVVERLRELIRDCTRGAPEWEGRLFPLVRVGEKVYSRESLTGHDGETTFNCDVVAFKAWSSLKLFWEREIERIRPMFGENVDAVPLPTFSRPTLEEVLAALEKMEPELCPIV